MMTLEEASRFFDDNVFTDTYGSSTFFGQLLPFADNVRSGSSARRRILEVGASTTIPAQRTVTSESGKVYLIAAGSEDLFQGEVVRVKYPVLPASTQYAIRSIGEALAGSGGVTGAYMSPSYVRRNLVEDQSDYLGAYEIYHSAYYSIAQGQVLSDGVKYYRARESSRVDDAGFGVVEAVELESPMATYTYVSRGALDPVTDAHTDTNINGVACFIQHIVLDFQHEALGYVELKPGDKALSCLKTAVALAKVGDKVGPYRVLAVDDNTTYWTMHVRK